MNFQNRRSLVQTFIALALALASAGYAFGQKSTGAQPRYAFEPAEELFYEAEFSRALLRNVNIAEFHFAVSKQPVVSRSGDARPAEKSFYALKLTGDVSSKGFFSKLFSLNFRERMESIVEPASFTVQKTKRLDQQGKRVRSSEATYDQVNGRVVWIERDPNNPSRAPRTTSSSFNGQVQDILSAIYYLRTQPLVSGKTFELTVSDSGSVYQVPVRVIQKKRMKTVMGRVEAVQVELELFGPKRMIAREGYFFMWLTDDSRRVPVKARIKNEYGTIDITLKKRIHNAGQEYLTKR